MWKASDRFLALDRLFPLHHSNSKMAHGSNESETICLMPYSAFSYQLYCCLHRTDDVFLHFLLHLFLFFSPKPTESERKVKAKVNARKAEAKAKENPKESNKRNECEVVKEENGVDSIDVSTSVQKKKDFHHSTEGFQDYFIKLHG